jgi:N utilization substance protein B
MEEEVIERRELAFRYIYSEEIQQQNSKAGVKLFLDANEIDDQRKREYVKDIAKGIKDNKEEIENIISGSLKDGWTMDRISLIDFALLKLAVYEIKYKEVPYKVVINEAINLAKKYGEEKSYIFINGVLANIVKDM